MLYATPHTSSDPMLNPQALQVVKQKLSAFASQDSFESSIEQIFGSKIDKVKLSILRGQLRRNDFSVIPEIEVLAGDELGTANGGYAASTNKIYLSASFLATAIPAAITNVLLEEIGHAIDTLINSQDAVGDEGAIFAAFVQRNQLTTAELNILKAEDDRAYITVNGSQILIEQQNFPGTNQGETLTGSADGDLIQGFSGNDTLLGLGGNDILDGGEGNDTITGGSGSDTIIFDRLKGNDIVTDFVRGQDKIDVRNLNIGDWDVVKELITNDGLSNTLITNNYYNYDGIVSQLKLNGINPALLTATDFVFNANTTNLTVDGTGYKDDLFGGLSNDTLNGKDGDDRLFGGSGDDTLDGGAGNDIFTGGAGNDKIVFDRLKGNDVVKDFVRGQDKIDLRNLNISDWDVVKELITNDGLNNTLITNNYYNYDNTVSQLKLNGINPALLTASDFVFNANTTNLTVDGTGYKDDLFGGKGNDTLNGYQGNDRLFGGSGDDTLTGGVGNDVLEGGFGDDTAVFTGTRAQYQVTNTAGVYTVTDLVANRDGIDTLRSIQKIKFSDQNLVIAPVEATITLALNAAAVNEDGIPNLAYTFTRTGSTAEALTVSYSVVRSATLSDTDYTQTGAATFTATTGTITFAANSATAILTIDPKADGDVEINETLALKLTASPNYTIGTSAAVTGTINNDDISNRPGVALSINDITVVEGKDGNALLTVSLSSASNQIITVNYTTTAIEATANGDYTTKTGTLTIPANSLTGTISIPILNDNLNEVDESFTVTLSGAVNATIDPDASVAEVTITDTLRSAITRSLPANVENLTLIGAGAINGTGNAGNNTITGNSGSNILDGGSGADMMSGGGGNDSYYVDNIGDVVTETATGGIDTISSSITINELVLNVEKLTLTGTGAINGTGNSLDNIVIGNNSANTLYGAGGNDTLTGNLGADIFRFNSQTEGIDTITDFTAGDKIALSAVGFGGGLAGTAISASQFAIGSVATTSSQRVIYNSTTGGLFFDADGSGAGAAVQFGSLANKATLGATDFTVV
jgi:Ca2+-binding RTX toxin-like protein